MKMSYFQHENVLQTQTETIGTVIGQAVCWSQYIYIITETMNQYLLLRLYI